MNKEYIERYAEGIIRPLDGRLEVLRGKAKEGSFPIIQPLTARFLASLIVLKQPQRVLEIGCCIGFSAALMAYYLPEGGHITTIDRYGLMIDIAKENFCDFQLLDKVTLLEGDALDILTGLNDPYDFIFIDAAKGQYLRFLPHCVRLLSAGGFMLFDDVLQDGLAAKPRSAVPRRNRTTHARMREFLRIINTMDNLETSILPIDHGLALCVKREK